jgi:hypothetical protein
LLFRDRLRDESGFFPRLRLWSDLLADLAMSLPRMPRHAEPRLAADGAPAFHVLEDESLRPGRLLFGAILSLFALGVVPASITHYASPILMLAASGPQGSQQQQLDAAERKRVIDGAIANLKRHYIYPDAARKIASALLAHQNHGDYDTLTDGLEFAELLSTQMRDLSQDMHLDLIYSQRPLPDSPPAPTPEGAARYREAMQLSNCTFEKAEILPHNIGYLKLNSFPDPSVCAATATAAMAKVNNADAIIFDLRDNRGGFPGMVMQIAAYLFDHPEYMYNPRENTSEHFWTKSPVPGNKLADKPVYILTSAKSISAAEHFTYDLKMLRRATLVGETTGGAGHSGVFHRIDDHFGIAIPETRAINPFSKNDWAVTGVQPDVKVKAADALETAQRLAETALSKAAVKHIPSEP